MKFQIRNRWSGDVQFECELDASFETQALCFQLGAAIKVAFEKGSNLSGANLRGANLSGANLSGASLSGSDLRHADLSGANLSGSDLSGANLYGANLYGANLIGANLIGASLYGANLSGANLYGANLYGANLYGANLIGVNLGGADLRHADLSGANLSGADLRHADLRDAYLRGADLSGADLSGAAGIAPEICTDLLLLLDQPGQIRAYKLVREDGKGPHYPRITYEVGKSYEEKAACTDPNQHCAEGINLATLAWCLKEWRPGYRILICEFTATDIAAIPTGTDGKFRVHRCAVVAERAIDPVKLGLVKVDVVEKAT